MPTFAYKARDDSGKLLKGVVEAPSMDMAMRQVDQMGLTPVDMNPVRGKAAAMATPKARSGGGGKVKPLDIIIMSRQLVTLLRAGVPILTCMDALVAQCNSPTLKVVLEAMRRDVQQGSLLSASFAKYPRVFPPLYIHTVRAGETGGVLPEVLGRLSDMLEEDLETVRSVKGAMRYPLMVVISLVIAFFVLITLVVPRFAALFARFDTELPLPTRILIATNSLVTDWWYIFFPALFGGIAAVYLFVQTKSGRFLWDGMLLRLPVFGDLILKMSMARFARMFATLYRAGVPVLRVVEIVSATVGNVVVGAEISKIGTGIKQGQGLADPLKGSKFYPPMVVHMMSVGEKSGALDEMLGEVSKHYESETKYLVRNLTSLIEPMLIVGLGLIVLLLALGIFLPMWNLIKLFR